MLLNRLDIAELRGLKDLALPDLAPINLIVGPNNTGKSSILEAAALLLRPFDPSAWAHVALQRSWGNLVRELWRLFPGNGVLRFDDRGLVRPERGIRVSGVLGGASRALEAHVEAREDGEDSIKLTISVEVDGQQGELLFPEWSAVLPAREPARLPSMLVVPSSYRYLGFDAALLSTSVERGDKALVMEILGVFVPNLLSVDSVRAASGAPEIVLTHAEHGPMPLSSMGDGVRHSATMALALSESRGGVLLLDEIEAAIHPSALPEVTGRLCAAARRAQAQSIATTHSLEAIDAFLVGTKDQADRVAVYHLLSPARDERVRRYDHAKAARLRASGLDLR